jgi:phosphate transport system substrate-binding protein
MKQLKQALDLRLLLTVAIALIGLLFSISALAEVTTIKIDGSSTVFPITEAAAEEFQASTKGKVRVTVGKSGTGGGFKKFCRGETDVQNASRPIQSSEMEICRAAGIKYFELPVAFDAMVIAVHPSNKWLTQITVEELKKMWEPSAQGQITTWNQVNAAWPKDAIRLFGAGSDSGTFDYFTEAIVGKAKASRGDYTGSEDDNTLVQGIASDKNALGYLPLSYYEENRTRLRAVPVVGGAKSPGKDKAVLPSKETVENGSYWPLARPIFIYVSEQSAARSEVKDFTKFYLSSALTLVPQVKYVALPKKAYDMALEKFNKSKVGTAFSGHSEVGLSVEELLKKEGKL